jgi:hypothetical protein
MPGTIFVIVNLIKKSLFKEFQENKYPFNEPLLLAVAPEKGSTGLPLCILGKSIILTNFRRGNVATSIQFIGIE